MNVHPEITFELNYEWSSEEDDGKERSLTSNANLQVCSYDSQPLQITYFIGCTMNGNIQMNVHDTK